MRSCDRGTRESTPCSLIRQPESIRTPGSTTRPSTARPTGSMEGRGVQNSTQRQIPTAHEMDQFFARVEEEQIRQFVEKYILHWFIWHSFYDWLHFCDFPFAPLLAYWRFCFLCAGTTLILLMICHSQAVLNGRKSTLRRLMFHQYLFSCTFLLILSLGIMK